jgi:hypothetical protein
MQTISLSFPTIGRPGTEVEFGLRSIYPGAKKILISNQQKSKPEKPLLTPSVNLESDFTERLPPNEM